MDAAKSPVADVVWRKDDPQAGILPTYSDVARRMARERLSTGASPFVGESSAALSTATSRQEITARELAAFLREPLKAVLRYRLGIAVEGTRDTGLDPDSPLGISEGLTKWDLQSAWLADNRGLDAVLQRLRLSGGMPGAFLGDFASAQFHANLVGKLPPSLSEAGVMGEVMRVAFPTDVQTGAAESAHVRWTAEIANWRREGRDVSVVVSGSLKGAAKNPHPVHRVLDAFLAFLMFAASARDTGAWHLKVFVLDLDEGGCAAWHWRVTAGEALDYLVRLTARYLSYLRQPAGGYADFGYVGLWRNLVEKETGGIDWQATHERLTAQPSDYRQQVGYNGDLVIERTKDSLLRPPSVAEAEELFGAYYALPFAAEKEKVA